MKYGIVKMVAIGLSKYEKVNILYATKIK